MSKYFNDMCNVLNGLEYWEFPYPMGVSKKSFSDEIYNELASNRPTWEYIAASHKDKNNKRVDMCARDILSNDTVPEIWREFVKYHTSHDFYLQILKIFEKDFKQFYPNFNFGGMTTAVRYLGENADLYMDCQIGINTPVKEKSTVSAPHIDHPNELWAGLLYMREPDDCAGGDLIIYKCRDLPRQHAKRQIHTSEIIPHSRISYLPNQFTCFLNSPFSIHSVTERETTDKPRLLVNFSIEFKNTSLFNFERMR